MNDWCGQLTYCFPCSLVQHGLPISLQVAPPPPYQMPFLQLLLEQCHPTRAGSDAQGMMHAEQLLASALSVHPLPPQSSASR